ncbi:MAG: hypothetical protein LBD11_07865 [Candidatus Peribacteria bacterium]|nr:hypothetical protein [Candidatus Peribacteria bacterium]
MYTAQIIEKKYTYNKIVYEKVIGEDGEEKETAKTIAVEKTIKDLWESGDKNEAEVAKRYSNKIITALLESYLLLSNDKGKII